ncbi:MAG: YkgJ family cysteine cluster protein [Sphingomonadales bacterium]|nr:YkgJ family cysteine cluster protein [Sphingomonadales bacterium]MDE2169146.1 YkgJ family cysteine cluster protein [Sphingomonadales bacterium]
MDVHFDCTQCGKCCHGLRLTLSVAEAIAWAERGHSVQLLTEALPWPGAADRSEAQNEHDRKRSFAAFSDQIAVRIAVVLVAFHEGGCPHLLPTMLCGNYADRPRICRIYPLESRPFAALLPGRRLCPPEAWAADGPLLERDGTVVPSETADVVAEHRRIAIEDVPALEAACEALGVSSAAFAHEGLAVHTPDPALLARTLRMVNDRSESRGSPRNWTIVTNRGETLNLLRGVGCAAALVARGAGYLGSFPDDM